MPMFAAVRTASDDFWMAFSATLQIGSYGENPEADNPMTVFFCDYALAGNTWRRDSFCRTWFPIVNISIKLWIRLVGLKGGLKVPGTCGTTTASGCAFCTPARDSP